MDREDLFQHLERQRGFLARSGRSFDEGFEDEAARLAVATRVLVHGTAKSVSLLKQLNLKEGLLFWNSAYRYDPKNLLTHTGLVLHEVGRGGARYKAPLDEDRSFEPRRVGFDEWWLEIVLKDTKSTLFSRKDLVLLMANKEGGRTWIPR